MDDHTFERVGVAGQGPPRRAAGVERQPGVRPFSDREVQDVPGRVVEERNQPRLPNVASEAEFSEVRVKDLQRSDLRLVASLQQVRPRSGGPDRSPYRARLWKLSAPQREIPRVVQPLD